MFINVSHPRKLILRILVMISKDVNLGHDLTIVVNLDHDLTITVNLDHDLTITVGQILQRRIVIWS